MQELSGMFALFNIEINLPATARVDTPDLEYLKTVFLLLHTYGGAANLGN